MNGRGNSRLGRLYARVSGLDVGGSAGGEKGQILENGNQRTRNTRATRRPSIEKQKTLYEKGGPVTRNLMSRETEFGSMVNSVAEASAYRIDGKSLVTLQVKCRSIYNTALEF
jgi:hypothetical protein